MRKEARKVRIAVLASGRGSNFTAIAEAVQQGEVRAEIAFLFSNKADAKALDIAAQKGIPAKVLESGRLSRDEFDKKLLALLQEEGIDLVLLAGFMKIVAGDIVRAFPGRIINIHPSLLPSFKGLSAQKQALEYGAKVSGCTVHFVDEGVDTGPIILQSAVVVFDDDTEESLAGRILRKEHEIYVEAVKLFCEGRLRIEGRKVFIDSSEDL